MSFAAINNTPANSHNQVIKTGNGNKVCPNLALIRISSTIILPIFSLSLVMIQPNNIALGCRRIDFFWDDIKVLLMNPTHYHATTFKSLFSIFTQYTINRGIISYNNGACHPLNSLRGCLILSFYAVVSFSPQPNISLNDLGQHWTIFPGTSYLSIIL